MLNSQLIIIPKTINTFHHFFSTVFFSAHKQIRLPVWSKLSEPHQDCEFRAWMLLSLAGTSWTNISGTHLKLRLWFSYFHRKGDILTWRWVLLGEVMQSDFSLCTASLGMVALQGLAWIKQVTDPSLMEHSRITSSFAASNLVTSWLKYASHGDAFFPLSNNSLLLQERKA